MAGGFVAPINSSVTGEPITQEEAVPLKPPKRSYAVELGVETLFSGEWGQAVGVSWKSAALSDYYWGVHADETSLSLAGYEARGGLGWEAGLRGNYYLTKSLRVAVSANYERLQHSIAMSPLVRQDYVFGYFAGLGWQF
jgi:hypothetical protein